MDPYMAGPGTAAAAAAMGYESSAANFARGGTDQLARAISRANDMSSGEVVIEVDGYRFGKATRNVLNKNNSVGVKTT